MSYKTADQITTGDRILWDSVGPVFATVTAVQAYYSYRIIDITVESTDQRRVLEEHSEARFTVACAHDGDADGLYCAHDGRPLVLTPDNEDYFEGVDAQRVHYADCDDIARDRLHARMSH